MKIKGIVEITIVDKDGNIKDYRWQENIIPDNSWVGILGPDAVRGFFINYSNQSGTFSKNISISTDTEIPVATNYTILNVIGTATTKSNAWNESLDPPFGTTVGQISPTGVSRTFNSVAITALNAADTQSIFSTTAYAWLLLDLPCTQGINDFINITYTIQFLDNIGQGYIDKTLARYDLGRCLFNVGQFRMSAFATTLCSPTQQTLVDLSFADQVLTTDYSNVGVVASHFKYKYTFTPPLNDYLGQIFNAFTQGRANDGIRAYCFSGFKYDKAPFQTGFAHGSASNVPFFDSNNPANSQAKIILAGTWQSELPEIYKITITTNGDATTATYKFSVGKHLGFSGNTYTVPTALCLYRNTSVKFLANLHGWQETNFDIFAYSDSKIVQYDATGVTILDLIDGSAQTWDASSTAVLSTTNINQIAIDLANTLIYVADRTNGLFVINVTANTVTHPLTGVCYGVDVGRNNVAYAITPNGIFRSSDGFATPLSFTYVGISDNNWSRVKFLKADPEYATDRLAIVADNGTGTNQIIWYEISTNTVTAGYSNSALPNYPASFDVSDTGSNWAFHLSDNNFYKIAFNATTTTAGYQGFGKQVVNGDSKYYAKISFYKDNIIGPTSFLGGSTTFNYSGPGAAYDFSSGRYITTSFGIPLSGGIFFWSNYLSNIFSGNALFWTNYGWNGTSWDTISTNSKTCHTSQQALLNGLTIAFQNGANTPQLVANEFFTQSVCYGLLKDNATSFVYNTQWYSKPIFYDTTLNATIPNSNAIALPATTNSQFRMVDVDTVGVHAFTIAGSPVTKIWTDTTNPASTEINLQANGNVTFNAADQGKAFAGSYLWIGI